MADIKQAARWAQEKILAIRTNDPLGPWIGDHRPLGYSERGGGLVYSRFIYPDGTMSIRLEDILANDWEIAPNE